MPEDQIPTLEVGQTVVVRDLNGPESRTGGEPRRKVVTKVGRKLVTVGEGWQAETYRLEPGLPKNDKWGHAWLQTEEAWAETKRQREIVERLNALPRRPLDNWRQLPATTLARVERVLDDAVLAAFLAEHSPQPLEDGDVWCRCNDFTGRPAEYAEHLATEMGR